MTTETLKSRAPVRSPRSTAPRKTTQQKLDVSVVLSEKQQQELAEMADYVSELTSSKEKSVAFLKRAGILNTKGDIAKPYRG